MTGQDPEPHQRTMLSRARQVELMVSTAWAMTAATAQLFVIAVLAASMIEEFGISRWQIGFLGAINTGVGALAAPRLGGLTDRLGSGRAIVALVALSGVGLLLTSAATNYWLLLGASALAGLPQGASNPVTNKVIADEVPLAQQGSVMGVKQSGVQFAVFLAGATMPSAAVTFGWRLAVAGFGAAAIVTAFILNTRFDTTRVEPLAPKVGALTDSRGLDPGAARFVNQVAIYAFMLGMSAGGVTRFYPLFANEILGYSEAIAGLSVSVAGLSAIAARMIWAKLVESTISTRTALIGLGIGSAVSIMTLFVAESGARWLLWPAVVGMAFSVVAWNVVAMLAVVWSVPARDSGRATGTVLLGFLGGLTVAAPLVGWSVDQFGSYRPSWVGLSALALIGALTVARRPRPRVRSSAEGIPSSGPAIDPANDAVETARGDRA
ncbi:MAG: MFS transporter [Actinomycetia bacterium]|nr:MFS transporter [Actinomycetes bacterium]MCP5030452.1 MFS transporter [Actinomycetes bacterium]